MTLREQLEQARQLALHWRETAYKVADAGKLSINLGSAFPWEIPPAPKVKKKPGPKRFMYVMQPCPECRPGAPLALCKLCGGLGRVKTQQRLN